MSNQWGNFVTARLDPDWHLTDAERPGESAASLSRAQAALAEVSLVGVVEKLEMSICLLYHRLSGIASVRDAFQRACIPEPARVSAELAHPQRLRGTAFGVCQLSKGDDCPWRDKG